MEHRLLIARSRRLAVLLLLGGWALGAGCDTSGPPVEEEPPGEEEPPPTARLCNAPRGAPGGQEAVALDTLRAPLTTLAVDADGRVFLGTDGGGLFRSTDGGARWTRLGFDDTWVYRAWTAPGWPLYAVTVAPGYAPVCLFGSDDGGASWQRLEQGEWFDDFAVGAGDTLYGGSYPGGVLYSTDRGATWRPTGLSPEYIEYVARHPEKPQLFAWRQSGVGHWHLYRSNDAGRSWTSLMMGHVGDLLVDREGRVLVGMTGIVEGAGGLLAPAKIEGGGVLLSTDGGDTWTESLSRSGIWALLEVGPSTFLAGTLFGLYRSEDAAATWALVDPTQNVVALAGDVAAGPLYAFGGGRCNTLLRSEDRGLTWTQVLSTSGGPRDWGCAYRAQPGVRPGGTR